MSHGQNNENASPLSQVQAQSASGNNECNLASRPGARLDSFSVAPHHLAIIHPFFRERPFTAVA